MIDFDLQVKLHSVLTEATSNFSHKRIELDYLPSDWGDLLVDNEGGVVILYDVVEGKHEVLGGRMRGYNFELNMIIYTNSKAQGSEAADSIARDMDLHFVDLHERIQKRDIDNKGEGSGFNQTFLVFRSNDFRGVKKRKMVLKLN